ncbi:unnamed protein product [Caenorhabditis auriculariae]|uniref:Uncharacterized protein n=1 Tax=Caenorhabditis auriculariae TaxID=2777116 RepID=A0A8S1HCC3_9PELO|nr:unnamed protein product [Caenorhabditis auriculariae]
MTAPPAGWRERTADNQLHAVLVPITPYALRESAKKFKTTVHGDELLWKIHHVRDSSVPLSVQSNNSAGSPTPATLASLESFWPSGLRRCVQVAVLFGGRRDKEHSDKTSDGTKLRWSSVAGHMFPQKDFLCVISCRKMRSLSLNRK